LLGTHAALAVARAQAGDRQGAEMGRGDRGGEADVLIAGQGAMASKFERERSRVELLIRRLGLAPTVYRDPQTGGRARDETGADVVALLDGRGVGIQVTDLDTGHSLGKARASEAK